MKEKERVCEERRAAGALVHLRGTEGEEYLHKKSRRKGDSKGKGPCNINGESKGGETKAIKSSNLFLSLSASPRRICVCWELQSRVGEANIYILPTCNYFLRATRIAILECVYVSLNVMGE